MRTIPLGLNGQINPWRPGNAAIFRIDRTVPDGEGHSFVGKVGKVYWITDKFELEEIGQADLGKTDEDIARRRIFLVPPIVDYMLDEPVPGKIEIPQEAQSAGRGSLVRH